LGFELSARKTIAKNTAVLFTAQMVISLLSVVLSIVIARRLGDVSFGEYSFAIAFSAIFVMIADLGYLTLFTREVSKDNQKADEYLSNVLGFRVLSTFAMIILIVLFINLLGYSEEMKQVVYIFGAFSLVSSLSGVFYVTYRSFQRMEYEAMVTVAEGSIRIALGIVVLLLGYGLIELGFVFLFSSLLGLTMSAVICRKKFVRPRLSFSPRFFKVTILLAVSLSTLPILATIHVRLGTIKLSLLESEAAVGWYNAAYNIILTTKLVPSLFLTSVFPAAMSISSGSKDLYYIYYEKAIKGLLILGVPLSLGLILLADPIIMTLYGGNFSNAIIAMQILSMDCLLFFVYMPLGNALIGLGKEKNVAISTFIGVMMDIILNLLLIPPFGLAGSAVATIASEAVILGMFWYYFSSSLKVLPIPRFLGKPILASLPMVAIVLLVKGNVFLVIPIAMAAYFVTLFFIGGLDEEEETIVRNLIARVKRKILRKT